MIVYIYYMYTIVSVAVGRYCLLQINIQLGKEREVAKQLLKDGKKE